MGDVMIKVAQMPFEFPHIREIRQLVFQVGQGVNAELDFDGLDEVCVQLLAYVDGEAVGTARVRWLDEEVAKVERLAVLSGARGQGIGKGLMEKALLIARERGYKKVVIHSQEYIKGLHASLGFVEVGNNFTEAGISHMKMEKTINYEL